jgi:co-chaperonin GroES (HSP10)
MRKCIANPLSFVQSFLRNVKNLAPLLDRVLVQRIKPEAKTASGIFLPESSVKEQNEAKVLAVGPGAVDRNGQRIPMGVSAGDRVLIPQVRFELLLPDGLDIRFLRHTLQLSDQC